jgi:2-polyprenyl-6-hydroxyphenyl methylase/3-demethylubiquinone-9 3-methyltransferase
MKGYYQKKLAADRLLACYELAPARVKAYLESEIDFVLEKTSPRQNVLELGCGYGRVLKRIATKAGKAFGIDTSLESLRFARDFLPGAPAVRLLLMDAARMGFKDRRFDLTLCIQNGISAFAVDRQRLFGEALRVTRSGGTVLFSSYSPRFWNDRLEWFEIQSARGLLGEIDREATGNGVIVCRDGFRATTVDAEEFRRLAAGHGVLPRIVEVNGSSLFCEVPAP